MDGNVQPHLQPQSKVLREQRNGITQSTEDGPSTLVTCPLSEPPRRGVDDRVHRLVRQPLSLRGYDDAGQSAPASYCLINLPLILSILYRQCREAEAVTVRPAILARGAPGRAILTGSPSGYG